MKQGIILLFLIPLVLFGQDYRNEDYVFLKRHEYIKIDLNNHDFKIAKEVTQQAEFITANKLYFANEVIGYDSFKEIKDIEAFTYIPATDKKIEVDYIETKREFDNGVFYSDQEYKHFIFPAVTKGAVTNLNYTEDIKDPHFLGLYNFGSYVPTKSGKLVVEFPNNVEIGYIDFNTDNVQVDFEKKESADKNIYTWSVSNLNGFQPEENSEEQLHFLPHIIVYIKSYEIKGQKYNVLNSEADLYRWYVSLVEQIDTSELDMVKSIADGLVNADQSDHEKAEAIFNWVQDNITYVAFEDGLGGFIPRSASSVCNKRYGDCKDMANLLFEMLNHVGIEAYRAWIGTRNRPYSYYEVPTPMVDNHMITAAIVENDTIFLDATDSYVPFGMPSGFTQTKEALIGIDADSYQIVKVPVQKPEKSLTKVVTEMALENNTLKVHETRELTGYDKVDLIAGFVYQKDDKTEEEYLNTTLQLGNNKTKYKNITKENFDNKSRPLVVSYDLEIDNYAKTVGSKTFINMNIDRVLSKSKIDIEGRKYSKKIDHKYQKEYRTTFTLPEGYKIVDVPDKLSFDDPKYGYVISYEIDGNNIIQTKHIYINTLSVKNEEFELWNSFIKSIIKAYKKSITIEKIS